MFTKKIALIALASTALAVPAYASNAEIDMLMKEINKLKSQVSALQKKSSEPVASAAPVTKPVIACEAYGEGFYVIPGTSTCLRISGYARAGATLYENGASGVGVTPLNERALSNVDYGARMRLTADARSSTDMGVLRGVIRGNFDLSAQTAAGSSGLASSPRIGYAYASLGGFSAGLQDSAFTFFGTPGDSVGLIVADESQIQMAASYTASLGAGLSGTVAVENPLTRKVSSESGVTDIPDIVGALQMVQGPATYKLSASTHQSVGTNSGEVQGYAVQGGMRYVLSPETTFVVQGTYANAAMAYLGYGRGSSSAPWSTTGILSVSTSADYEQNSNVLNKDETSSGWSLLGNLQQKVGPGVFWLTGTYGFIDDKSPATNVEARVTQAELSYVYSPYTGFKLQPAVSYQKIDNTLSTGGPVVDPDQYKALFRVWREF